ncbi:MAG TPA: hypothetical protein VFL12_14100, partial [Thermoanaerobaculia bacterium]|nr:hypothetical protein [Thermoanaerobaculia bacterium]
DTNPAFFERRRAAAAGTVEFPPPPQRPVTADFNPPPQPEPAKSDDTSPMSIVGEAPPAAIPGAAAAPPPAVDAASMDASVFEFPVPAAPEPAADAPTAPPEPREERAASPLEERMIQLAVVSAWGDRISAAEEKISGWDALEQRIAALERGLSGSGEMPNRVAALESRLGAVEGARAWSKDFDLLRTDWANARLAAESQIGELRKGLADVRQTLAEGSGREMELVAQMSRESLGTAAAFEKLGFRIQETEEKFSQLVVDQESRLARLERLVDEQSARGTADRESERQALLELEERFRTFREEVGESGRRIAGDLEEGLRRAREDFERRRSDADELRTLLADAIGDLVSRLRPS